MKGLLILPKVMFLIIGSYLGLLFVEANRQDVVIQFGNWKSSPTALGFVVLTSILIGMIFAGLFCSVELAVMMMRVRKLQNKLAAKAPSLRPPDRIRRIETADPEIPESKSFTPL